MGGNPIGDDGLSLVIDGLQHNKTLTKLYVYECRLSAKGTMHAIVVPVICSLVWGSHSHLVLMPHGVPDFSSLAIPSGVNHFSLVISNPSDVYVTGFAKRYLFHTQNLTYFLY